VEILNAETSWLKSETLPIKILLNKTRDMDHGIYRHDEHFVFHGLPMPPSANNMYATSRSGHRFKVQAAKDFERDCQLYYYKFKKQIDARYLRPI